MKQYAQQVRTQLLTLIMAGMAGAGVATAATAAGLGGVHAADDGTGFHAPDPAQTGGTADTRLRPPGSANGNATERMNADGEMKRSGDADREAADTATAKDKRKP